VIETKFNEYAAAGGTPQLDEGIGSMRETAPTNDGGPNGPVVPVRVSNTRHGVIAINTKPAVGAGVVVKSAATAAAVLAGGQFFSATV
jgi:hypothetical protein